MVRSGDDLSMGHNSQQFDCAEKVSEFRFKSVKSFYPRSCQWWHLELVGEHLPESLLSSKVRSMTAVGLHQPLAQSLRSAVEAHTGKVYDSLGFTPVSGSATQVTLASELLASQFSGYLALAKEPDLSKPVLQHRIHEIVASPTIKHIVPYVISGGKVLRRNGRLCDQLTTMQTLSARRFPRGGDGKEEFQADTRGPIRGAYGGGSPRRLRRGFIERFESYSSRPMPKNKSKDRAELWKYINQVGNRMARTWALPKGKVGPL